MVGARKERKSRSLVLTGEERKGDGFFGMLRLIRMTPGWADDPVRRQAKRIQWGRREIGCHKGEGGAGPISIRKNKRWILGPEWLMSGVGTPPPHNLEEPHRLVASIININNNKNTRRQMFVSRHIKLFF